MGCLKERNAPLDFFSWHTYDDVIEHNVAYAQYVRERLDFHGFTETENICDEWNVNYRERGSMFHASSVAAMLLAFQTSPLDISNYYDARCGNSIYGGMFHCLTQTPYPAYYAFTAFNRLYKLKNQISVTVSEKDVYAVGAKNEKWACVVIANPTSEAKELNVYCSADIDRYVITDALGVDRECYAIDCLPKESIVSVYFDLR